MAVNEETSVYVGGLPYDADEDMLRVYFEPCGTIVSVKVIHSPPPFCFPYPAPPCFPSPFEPRLASLLRLGRLGVRLVLSTFGEEKESLLV